MKKSMLIISIISIILTFTFLNCENTKRILEENTEDIQESEWKNTHTLKGHASIVNALAFSPDGNKIASGSWDSTIIIWEWDGSKWNKTHTLKGHVDSVNSVEFTGDGNMLISGGINVKVWEWDDSGWKNTQTLTEYTDYNNSITSIDINSDGNMIVASSWDSTIIIWEWDGSKWNKTQTIKHNDSVKSVSFSSDGNKLISAVGGHYDATINIMEWNNESWESKYSLEGFYMTWYASFIRDENKFVTGTGYGKVKIWEWNGPKFTDLQTLNGLELFPDSITSLDLSPDNNIIICGSMKMIKMWKRDGSMWIQLPPLTGHSSLIDDVKFSPDGTKIASAGGFGDETIKIWEK
jgi:WD40 repeat protein